jgi:hypothetical protein
MKDDSNKKAGNQRLSIVLILIYSDVVEGLKKLFSKPFFMLTVNGRAELVVQDAASYQKLLELLDYAEAVEGIKQGLESMRRGEGRPAAEVFQYLHVAPAGVSWYSRSMEQTSFALTPEQKGMLAALWRETGKPVPTLLAAIAHALEELQESEPLAHPHGDANGTRVEGPPPAPQAVRKPIWEQFADAFADVPDEDLDRLPTDLAAQVDHYVYGLPKRPA